MMPPKGEMRRLSDQGTPYPTLTESNQMSDTERLDEAVRFGLGLSELTSVADISYGQTEEWDSVAHMQLIAALENTFDIMIDTDDVIAMSDYGEVRRILKGRYGVALEP
jgi:hypothetical protein